MNTLNVMTEKDRKEAAAIDRRRTLEEERKKRIFNAKQRLIGVDYDALDKQVDEKKKRDAAQKEIDKKFTELAIQNDTMALILEKHDKQKRMKINRDIDMFRLCCQKPEDRREFDLNDPNYKKKSKPVRGSGDDSNLGLSAAQKFAGEDLSSEERRALQREQIKAWLDQQMQEREKAENDRKAAEEAFIMMIRARDERALEMERLEKECRRKMDEAELRFNQQLIREKKAAEQRKKKEETQDNMAEIYNFLTSDMLTESSEGMQRQIPPGKPGPTRGLTCEQKMEFKNYLMEQIAEKRKAKEEAARKEREYQDYFNGLQQTVALMDKEQKKKIKENEKAILEENKKLAVEQKVRKEYMKRVVYNCIPSDEFFSKFNSGTR